MFPTPNDSAHQASEFGTFGSGARGAVAPPLNGLGGVEPKLPAFDATGCADAGANPPPPRAPTLPVNPPLPANPPPPPVFG